MSLESLDIGQILVVGYQTIGFQGQHGDKLWIGSNNTGDGFRAGYIFEDGYTFWFHFRNESPLQQWVDRVFYPLHSHVLVLLDCVI